jgi:MscS family membrane protein
MVFLKKHNILCIFKYLLFWCGMSVMISNHDDIDTERHNIVAMVNGNTNMGSTTESAFGAYGVNFFISVFTKNIKIKSFHKTQDEILMKVSSIIKSHNAEIAFPTLSLHSNTQENNASFN